MSKYKVGLISRFCQNNSSQNIKNNYEINRIDCEVKKNNGELYFIDIYKIRCGVRDNHAFCDFWDSLNTTYRSVDYLDAIIVRSTRGYNEEIVSALEYVKSVNKNIVIMDDLPCLVYSTSKTSNISIRARYGIPQPDSEIFYPKEVDVRNFKPCIGEYPYVMKPTSGSKGKNVKLIGTYEEFQDYISKNFINNNNKNLRMYGEGVIVQEKLENHAEYRIVVVGDKALGCVRKGVPSERNVIARNKSYGVEFHDDVIGAKKNLLEEMAVRASQIKEYSFAGVDIIESNGKYYVLECNRSPQFEAFEHATGVNVASEIVKYCLNHVAAKNNNNYTGSSEVYKYNDVNALPRIFLGSVTEDKKEVGELVVGLEKDFELTPWYNFFSPGDITLEALYNGINQGKFDYAIFYIGTTFKVIRNGKLEKAGDNVVFEIGMFLSKLGKDKIIIVIDEDNKKIERIKRNKRIKSIEKKNNRNVKEILPSDLNGLTVVYYNSSKKNAIEEVAKKIFDKIYKV